MGAAESLWGTQGIRNEPEGTFKMELKNSGMDRKKLNVIFQSFLSSHSKFDLAQTRMPWARWK
jgi:hypothetical protein